MYLVVCGKVLAAVNVITLQIKQMVNEAVPHQEKVQSREMVREA